MPRNKYPEITEQRILDTATKLFMERGWEQTTIQDIVDELGDLTRGAFYHHFKSKEDIIDAVLNRIDFENDPLKAVHNMTELNGLEKLKKAFLLSLENTVQLDALKSAPAILTDPRLIAKQLNNIPFASKDILALINEGISDGSIHVAYPEQTAETYMMLTNIWLSPIIFSVTQEEYTKKARHLQEIYSAIGLEVIDAAILNALEKTYSIIHTSPDAP